MIAPSSNSEAWDFGGGSNSTQNWSNWSGDQKNLTYIYENPIASGKALADGWQLKNPHAAYAIASDISPGLSDQVLGSLRKRVDPDGVKNLPSANTYTGGTTLGRSVNFFGGNVARGEQSGENQKQPVSPTIASAAHGAALSGAKTYSGYTKISGGDLVLGDSAAKQDEKQPPLSAPPKVAYEDIIRYSPDWQRVAGAANGQKGGQCPLSASTGFKGNIADDVPLGNRSSQAVKEREELLRVQAIDSSTKLRNEVAADSKGSEKEGRVPPDTAGPIAGDTTVNVNSAPAPVLETLNFQQGAPAGQAPLLAPPGQPANPVTAPTTQVIDDRKIIRTGSMEFEVDRFDTAQVQITKIVGELGGFVGATDSTKLPNGKVHGSISVRVPPERLDTLVLSLRALGDLKSQQITAADITKEYTDLESELTADRAMQERLLDLIHNGKGSVKELLAAENELGVWRTKIEKAEGMIRYYNGQVALSTLSITLSERDIPTPAAGGGNRDG